MLPSTLFSNSLIASYFTPALTNSYFYTTSITCYSVIGSRNANASLKQEVISGLVGLLISQKYIDIVSFSMKDRVSLLESHDDLKAKPVPHPFANR